MKPALVDESTRIKRWHDASLDAIEAEERALDRAPRPDEVRRFNERKDTVERVAKARRTWVDEGLRTVDTPCSASPPCSSRGRRARERPRSGRQKRR